MWMNSNQPQGVPNCLRCRHYFVTWQASFPHGCRLFQMKSKLLPSKEVLATSGTHCQAYQPKNTQEEANKN
jgi:hypothetical protein